MVFLSELDKYMDKYKSFYLVQLSRWNWLGFPQHLWAIFCLDEQWASRDIMLQWPGLHVSCLMCGKIDVTWWTGNNILIDGPCCSSACWAQWKLMFRPGLECGPSRVTSHDGTSEQECDRGKVRTDTIYHGFLLPPWGVCIDISLECFSQI